MGKFKYLFFLLLGFLFFICPQKVKAADLLTQEVVINEIFYNPIGVDAGLEWIELYNPSAEPKLLIGYDLYAAGTYYTFGDFTLSPGSFVVVHINTIGTNTATDLYQGTSDNMGNTSGAIALFESARSNLTIIDFMKYGDSASTNTWQSAAVGAHIWTAGDYVPASQEGYSQGRFPNGIDRDSSADWANLSKPTPGAANIIIPSLPPAEPVLKTPNSQETIIGKNIIEFSWEESVSPNVYYNFTLSLNDDFSNPVVLESGLENPGIEVKLIAPVWGTYHWQVEAENENGKSPPAESAFILQAPVYSNAIIINEILPHPQNGTDYEFIELFNNGGEDVDVSGWYLDDIEGGSTPYEIPAGTKPILPGEYLVFYKTQTKLSLNDDGDSARLLFPDMQVASSRSYDEYAPLGLAWARMFNGAWAWTTTVTPGDPNIFTSEIIENAGGTDEEDIKIPINDEPIEIKTGDVANYRDYLITVSGEITRTSGNTFYIDDGSGEAKVYIQEKTGIDKPEMHTGDIFEIIGIVNLYRNTWRILPQKQDDVKLIEAIKKTNTVASKTTATKKKTSSQTVSANTQARAPTTSAIKSVKAAETENTSTDTENSKTSFWIQLAKMFVGLAIILLIIFVLKMRSIKKEKPIGADFGDDLT